eukprot:Anaeramoba_ignava/a487740_5.p1 GENE.a487740_5~~a487740_5.p1  ORF type:complete len:137 (-),score=31.90 a487740_5:11-367(-)
MEVVDIQTAKADVLAWFCDHDVQIFDNPTFFIDKYQSFNKKCQNYQLNEFSLRFVSNSHTCYPMLSFLRRILFSNAPFLIYCSKNSANSQRVQSCLSSFSNVWITWHLQIARKFISAK